MLEPRVESDRGWRLMDAVQFQKDLSRRSFHWLRGPPDREGLRSPPGCEAGLEDVVVGASAPGCVGIRPMSIRLAAVGEEKCWSWSTSFEEALARRGLANLAGLFHWAVALL